MTKNKWPKSDEKTGFGGTLGLKETQGDGRRIVPRPPPKPKVRGGALAPTSGTSGKLSASASACVAPVKPHWLKDSDGFSGTVEHQE